MTDIKDEPAFPCKEPIFVVPKDIPEEWRQKCAVMAGSFDGLSKRELIAAMAMQGFLACPDTFKMVKNTLVERSVDYADALLEELSK